MAYKIQVRYGWNQSSLGCSSTIFHLLTELRKPKWSASQSGPFEYPFPDKTDAQGSQIPKCFDSNNNLPEFQNPVAALLLNHCSYIPIITNLNFDILLQHPSNSLFYLE